MTAESPLEAPPQAAYPVVQVYRGSVQRMKQKQALREVRPEDAPRQQLGQNQRLKQESTAGCSRRKNSCVALVLWDFGVKVQETARLEALMTKRDGSRADEIPWV